MDFGEALYALKAGKRVSRKGWNGKGIFIKLQVPDKNSKMSSPYIYINTTGLQTNNPDAPKSRVPWLASQTDMLAEDYEIHKQSFEVPSAKRERGTEVDSLKGSPKSKQIDKIKDLAKKIEKALKVEKYVGTGAGIEVMFDACNRPMGGQYIHPICRSCTEHPINGGEGKCECESV